MLQNWIGGAYGRKFWSRRNSNQDWRCVNDKTRTQRIQLQCQDGSTRTYKITVVTSCKCKRFSRQHNESGNKFEELRLSTPQLLHKHKSKSKRRLGKNRLRENWHEAEPWEATDTQTDFTWTYWSFVSWPPEPAAMDYLGPYLCEAWSSLWWRTPKGTLRTFLDILVHVTKSGVYIVQSFQESTEDTSPRFSSVHVPVAIYSWMTICLELFRLKHQ